MTGQPPAVGYQGMPGAYSEEALVTFLPDARPEPHRTLADLFAALDSGAIDRMLVPVENSHAGSVVEAYDLMLDYPVVVEAEWIHPVAHALLGVRGAELNGVERVFSHPQALAQTSAYLRGLGVGIEPYFDTAGAAQMVAEQNDPRLAAVASRLAADRYGLEVLAGDIQTSADNATRFFLLAKGAWEPADSAANGSPGKTSIVFAVEHRPGALVRALQCFARQHVNLARLESRPSRQRPWEYLFFADIEGYANEERVRGALRELQRLMPWVRILGSYRRSSEPARERTNANSQG